MKTTLLRALYLGLFFFLSQNISFAQLDTIIVEQSSTGMINTCGEYYPQPEGTTTYRIYALLEDSTNHLSAMYGLLDGPSMYFNTTTSFFSAVTGGPLGNGNNTGICQFVPEAGFASFLTRGIETNADPGVVLAAFTVPSNPLPNSFGPNSPGNSFFVQDGLVFSTNDQPNSFPTGEDNRILLAQLTTDGDLGFQFALQIFPDVENIEFYNYQVDIEEDYVANNGTTFMFNGRNYGLYYQQGCTDEAACNFNPDATHDNNKCEYPTCGDPNACNFDAESTCTSAEACVYPGELNNSDCPENLILELPISSIMASETPYEGTSTLDLSAYAGQYVIAKTSLLLSNQEDGLSEANLTINQINYGNLINPKASMMEKNIGSVDFTSNEESELTISLKDDSNDGMHEEGGMYYMFMVPENGASELSINYILSANTIQNASADGIINFSLDIEEHFPFELCPADINKDNLVNLSDLLELLNHFGQSCQ
jgi:hypothetical protein